MDTEWIKVYETSKPHQAAMVQSILEEHNIKAVILNQQDSSYITIGEVAVYVSIEQAAEAYVIIDNQPL
ncbi:MAG: DUF2007 domain-containing protein [Chitinophagales bacterium]|nr:DUF2007 domain-containing protein [Chitinophagales bacterium]